MTFFFLIAKKAEISTTVVTALIAAYIGGKKRKGSTLGIRTLKRIATTTGIAIETIQINKFDFLLLFRIFNIFLLI
jgi:hypothetical protein